MYRLPWKYTIIRYTMSNASWRGASEGCRPKLPRWPFSASGCTHTAGTDLDRCMVRNLGAESSFFVQRLTFFCAPRAARFVVTFLPPASFLAPTPHRPSLIAPAVFCVLSASSGHRVNTWRERSTAKEKIRAFKIQKRILGFIRSID